MTQLQRFLRAYLLSALQFSRIPSSCYTRSNSRPSQSTTSPLALARAAPSLPCTQRTAATRTNLRADQSNVSGSKKPFAESGNAPSREQQ